MKLRVKKLPIILPLLVLAVTLTGTAIMTRLGRDSTSAHTNLGQKYLNDLNYTGAIHEFMQALSADPTAQDARLGLAEAYIASGNTDMATDILEPLTDVNDPSAYRLLIESQRDSDPRQALINAQKLVEHTDLIDDYELRDELLSRALSEAHSYATGLDQRLLIRQGAVYSAGSNTLGQLGTERGLATDSIQDVFQSAQFPSNAARVFCAGRTSYVVDEDGNLWAAGENRWGQLGQNYADMNPKSGWTQLTDGGDVAAVAGTTGTLLVLKTDGSLWYSGQGGIMRFERVPGFGIVSAIASNERQTAVLTVDGMLYLSEVNNPIRWTRQAGHVKAFCLSTSELIWVTEDNEINSQRGMYQMPDSWSWGNRGIIPDFAVQDIALDENGLLLMDHKGQLYRIYNGKAYEAEGGSVVNIYSVDNSVVVEQEDGTVLSWDLSQASPMQVAYSNPRN